LALLSGLRGLVLLFDEFEDVIQNLNNIAYERNAFNNLITLMNQRTFTGWAYFAVTPEFVAKCRSRLLEKMVYDYPVELFDDLERVKMTPVDEKDFLTLAALVRETHGIAYEWEARSGLPDRSLPPLVRKLFAAQQVDQVRHAMIGLVSELDRRLDG
jgi:hypothetical protein